MAKKQYLDLVGLTTYDGEIKAYIDDIASGKSDTSHTHDGRYYTESEIDSKLSTKAASSHNHSASNITSGTLPIARGGTGATTATGILTNLGITATASEINKLDGVTATTAELNILDGVTATATELNYVDGVTSNIQTQLNGKAASSHTHNYAGSSSAGGAATSANKLNTNAGDSNTPVYFTNGIPVACTSLDLNTSGNAATATKLATARNIGLGTGATGTATSFNGSGNITIPVTDVKESYLSWGGKNIAGGVSPIDAACSDVHSANRFAFAKPAGITIEYSTNGSTYNAYSTTDSAKINLVSGNGNTYYIGGRSTSTTVNDKLRITLNATNMGLYTRLRKLLINISTSYATGSNVIIEKAMKGSETTFTTIGTYNISGWSGWNSIPINSAFGGGSNQTGNIAVLRLTFGITGINSEQTSNALSVSDIIAVGDTYWSYPSTMAKTGHLYTYDSSQNATFPAKVTATGGFSGSLSGNATTATTASTCSGNSATATKLATARTISLTGDVSGSASFDGSANASITATVADDSHNHTIANVDNLQTTLDGKASSSHTHSYLPLSGGNLTGEVVFNNAKPLSWKNSSGTSRSVVQLTADNDYHFGYGSYANKEGTSYLSGDTVTLRSNTSVYTNCPVVVSNAKSFMGQNTSGENRNLAMINTDNNYFFGYGSYENSEGITYFDGNNVNVRSKNNIYLNAGDTVINFSPATGTYNGHFYPATTNKTTLGIAANRWYCLYQYASAVNTSDEREKHNIVKIAENNDVYEGLFNKLIPKTFCMNEGEEKTHIGFVAQDVAKALDEVGVNQNDSGLISHDYWVDEETGEEKDCYGLAYTEFIALNTYMIQKQQAKIKEQQIQIANLEERIAALEELVNVN